jgi:hypothetical protein
MLLEKIRKEYLKSIFEKLLTVDSDGIPNNADKHSTISVNLAKGIISEIGFKTLTGIKAAGQTSGKSFEDITANYLEKAFTLLRHLRNGKFGFFISKSIYDFEQYEHLALLTNVLKSNRELKATLGDYLISPDIVIGRHPVDDKEINYEEKLLNGKNQIATLTPLRLENSSKLILHASISCKWTIRSDRSQNSRTEGLNLIRNRKGKTPHIVIVTAEPYPQRIASLALGTGDIDCVYHFALKELIIATNKLNNESVLDSLETMVEGKRLRDISDLPFDLVT